MECLPINGYKAIWQDLDVFLTTALYGGKFQNPYRYPERIGGSLGTIQKHFGVWKAKQAPTVETRLSLSPELQRSIVLEMEKQVQENIALIDQELRDARVARDQLADENEQQAEKIVSLTDERDQAQTQFERATGSIESLRQELEQARAEILAAREEADRLVAEAREETKAARSETEQVRVELAKANLRLEQLPALLQDNKDLRAALEQEVISRTNAEKNAAVAEAVAVTSRSQ